jgi:hypothetical protein
MFEIEYEFREEDLIHFNEMQYLNSDEIQHNLKKNRLIVPGVMFIIGAFYYFYYGDIRAASYVVVLSILWAWLSPKILLLDFRRQILTNYTYKEKARMFGTYTLTLDPKGLLEKSPSGKNIMPWDEVIRVEKSDRYVFIYIGLNTALVIPRETVKKGNPDEFAEQAEKMLDRLG